MEVTGAAVAGPRRTADLLLRWRLALIGLLLALAAIGWISTNARMAGMDAGPGTDPGALGFYVSTWVVMMAAMMFPSIAPMVLMYATMQRGRRAKGRTAPADTVGLFVAGYLVIWTAAGLVGYGVIVIGRELDAGALAWDRAGRWVAAGVLFAAAAYEFTPLKHACLSRCRSPLGFLMGNWRDGRVGALRMGIVHGAWCVGCCWAIMAALFALGAMSLTWMIAIGALIAIEKLLPWERAATAGVAAVLVGLGIGIAVAPHDVPALTVPSGQGMSMHHDAMPGPGSHSRKPAAMPDAMPVP